MFKLYTKKLSLKEYQLALILILLLAFALRFYRAGQRWFIFADSARDILVAREALKTRQFPLVGSFSSAGPFVFGPLFYWLVSLAYLPNLNLLILPWILVGLISVVFVWVMAKSGEKLWGKLGAIILGLLASVSPAQVFRGLTLTQHSLVAISAAIILLTFISYFKSQKLKYLFFMGLGLGFGISMHYQAFNLIPFALVALVAPIYQWKKIPQKLLFLTTGTLIPSLPLLYWDSLQDWANFRNILDYFFIGQYRVYVANRWLTYIFQFWPQFWGLTIGGGSVIGWGFILLTLVFLAKKFLVKRLSPTVFYLSLIFLLLVVLLRYHRGEKFEGYLIYLHPLILFFSAWTLENLRKTSKILAILLGITVIGSLKTVLPEIQKAQNQAPQLTKIVKTLKDRFPGKKFSLYDYHLNTSAYSFGLAAFLDSENLIDEKSGVPIGVCLANCPSQFPVINDLYKPSVVADISSLPPEEFKKPSWYNVNPRAVHEDVALWWRKGRLKSSFSLQKFILGKLGLER